MKRNWSLSTPKMILRQTGSDASYAILRMTTEAVQLRRDVRHAADMALLHVWAAGAAMSRYAEDTARA